MARGANDTSESAAADPWLGREMRATFVLAWPICVANLSLALMMATDVMMLGWLSPTALAGAALGTNLYIPAYLFGLGVVVAIAPIAASLVGADRDDVQGLRRASHQAFFSAVILAAPLAALLWHGRVFLLAIGESVELSDIAQTYLRGVVWALAPALVFHVARSVYSALGRNMACVVASLAGVVFNAGANYALIFGKAGAPALGVYGSALATSLGQAFMALTMIAFAFIDPKLRPYRLFAGSWRWHWGDMTKLWKLGIPIGATILAEVSTFTGAGLAMGLIGAAALAAHSIVLQIASIAFNVPLSLGQAASVRVGHAYGARDAVQIGRAGWAAFWMTMIFVAASAATMLIIPHQLIGVFITPATPGAAEVVALSLSFLQIAALFQVFDGGQAALANMLRGIHDSHVPMIMALSGFWLIGAPVGLMLAFATPLKGLGLWIGLALGLAAVCVMLFVRWRGEERLGFLADYHAIEGPP